MNYITKSKFEEESLKWDTFIPKDANKLIIGTFPTEPGKRHYEFFYPNTSNIFWKLLSKIAEIELVHFEGEKAIEERKNILVKLNMGITDIGKKILRHNSSSADSAIFAIEFMDMFSILENHPNIEKLILTSSSGTNSVTSWLEHYFELNDKKFPKLEGKINPKRGSFDFQGRVIHVVTVHSTSGVAPGNLETKMPMYKNEIL